jgi:hypothetical protein
LNNPILVGVSFGDKMKQNVRLQSCRDCGLVHCACHGSHSSNISNRRQTYTLIKFNPWYHFMFSQGRSPENLSTKPGVKCLVRSSTMLEHLDHLVLNLRSSNRTLSFLPRREGSLQRTAISGPLTRKDSWGQGGGDLLLPNAGTR